MFPSLTNKLPSLEVIMNSLPITLWIANEIAAETRCCKNFCPQTGNFSATDRKGRTMQGLNCLSTAIGRRRFISTLKIIVVSTIKCPLPEKAADLPRSDNIPRGNPCPWTQPEWSHQTPVSIQAEEKLQRITTG